MKGSLASVLFLLSPLVFAADPLPPVAPQIPHSVTMFGDTRPDPYSWMLTYPGQEHSPEIMNYLNAENAYTASHFARLEQLRKQVAAEMRAKIGVPAASVPEEIGNYLYFLRQNDGQNYASLYRRPLHSSGEELVLDVNAAAAGTTYYQLGPYRISPDQKQIAWTASVGSLHTAVYVKSLSGGPVDVISETDAGFGDLVWSASGNYLFYSLHDSARRSYRIMRHRMGAASTTDLLIYEEKDPEYELESVVKSHDGKFIFITTQKEDLTSEVFYQDAESDDIQLHSFGERRAQQSYRVEHQGHLFYFISNHESVNQGIYSAPDTNPGRAYWKPVLAPSPARSLTDLLSFRGYLVVQTREKGVPQIEILNLNDQSLSPVHFTEPLYEATLKPFGPEKNIKFDRDSISIQYDSMSVADRTYDYNFKAKKLKILRDNTSGNFSADRFKTKRILVTSRDGVKIPVALIYRKDVKLDGKAPLFLSAYGNYGFNFVLSEPSLYSIPTVAPLVERGVIVAIASVRGGGELGPQWALDGKLQKKKNTFFDFIDVAEHLVTHHYTNPSRLGVRGISAAGLWLGFVTNNRPDLFRAVIARSPFVDLLNTELDVNIPLTTQEWTQWGNPNHEDDYNYMRSYSPYDNVSAHDYPNMLVEGSLRDNQVMIHEPAKWVARLRALKTDHNELLFRVNMTGAHGGDSGVTGATEDEAYDIAWMLDKLDVQ